MSRLYHKDLIQVLPDDLLIQQLHDCLDISYNLSMTGRTGNVLTEKITTHLPDEFYSYFLLVRDEILKRQMLTCAVLQEMEQQFMINMIQYTGRDAFSKIDYPRIFDGWMSPRYLQQCILILEEMYDNDAIELKDWFRIVNSVRNLNYFCEQVFECLFT